MSNQVLSDEQLEFLKRLPKAWRRGVVSPVSGLGLTIWVEPQHQEDLGILKRSDAAEVLIQTLDHHTNQAKEDERRRIDELGDKTIWMVGNDDRMTAHTGRLKIVEALEYFAALEAATNRESDAA